MIVRTYQRRSRALGRSLSGADLTSSSSQDSPRSGSSSHQQHRFFPCLPLPSQDFHAWPPIHGGSDSRFHPPLTPSGHVTAARIQNGKTGFRLLSGRAMENPPSKEAKEKANGRKATPGEMLRRAESILTGMQCGKARRKGGSSQECGAMAPGRGDPIARVWSPFAPPTSTLMEAQESGEMMESVDEANFALDGLRPERPTRIQRASLLSLLSICNSTQKRRFLRTHGIAKAVVDAVVCLPTYDPATTLAAAGLLYMLASDGQDEDLFDSSICIGFLIKLLRPFSSLPGVKDMDALNSLPNLNKEKSLHSADLGCCGNDHEGVAVTAKVISLLRSMKSGRLSNCKHDEQNMILLREELNSQFLALLTLEKACLSTVILEENSGSVRKVGGHFKESLRELGGLNTISSLAARSYMTIKNESLGYSKGNTLEHGKPLSAHSLNGMHLLQCCMKVMENVTFLSEANQRHLLEMTAVNEQSDVADTFIGLIICIIKTLSELQFLLKSVENSSHIQGDYRQAGSVKINTEKLQSNEVLEFASIEVKLSADVKAEKSNYKKVKETQLSFEYKPAFSEVKYHRRKTLKQSALDKSDGRDQPLDRPDTHFSLSSQFSIYEKQPFLPTSEDSCITEAAVANGNQIQSSSMIRSNDQFFLDDLQDPFDFSDSDLTLSECISKKHSKSFKRKMVSKAETIDISTFNTVTNADCDLRREDTSNKSQEHEGSFGESINQQLLLLGECLLSAVKVLMNLTNDNPIGCRQVASCGGLDAMVFILTECLSVSQPKLPLNSLLSLCERSQETAVTVSDGKHSEQELELLVVVLGILVNLVEKDTENRSLLASLDTDVSSHMTDSNSCSRRKDLIRFLCSIFLNYGSSDISEDFAGKHVMEMDYDTIIRKEEHEAESTIVEAYTALLLAFLSLQSDAARFAIASHLPGDNLNILVPVLERFVAFHLSLNMISSETHAVVRDVIESCKRS